MNGGQRTVPGIPPPVPPDHPSRCIDRRGVIRGVALAVAATAGRPRGTWATAQGTPSPVRADYAFERERLTREASGTAFGRGPAVEPDLGFRSNRARLAALYDYYGGLAGRDPERLLWAGLARLAGASVIAGLDLLVAETGLGYADPSPLTASLTAIASTVFLDLAWLHEGFLADPDGTIGLAAAHDAVHPARAAYAVAWTLIAGADAGAWADGNRALLANEQFSIVQPFYDRIRADPDGGPVLRATGALVPIVHPHHAAFRETVARGDLTDADDRWRWIAGPGGMWETWVAVSPAERARLIGLPLDDLVARRW